MQGRHFFTFIAIAALAQTAALAGEVRKPCPREQAQQQPQRQQANQAQQQRARSQGCPVYRNVPPIVDPTPLFIL